MNKRLEKMVENRAKMISAARAAFAEKGFAAASMDELTSSVGLTRGALYHNFGDKIGLLAAVVEQIDSEMAAKAKAKATVVDGAWEGLMAEGKAYIEMAMVPEVQRIVLLDGPAFLGDPSQWPSQSSCLQSTINTVSNLVDSGHLKPVDVEAISRLLNGAALNAALWVAASDNPEEILPRAIDAFEVLASGLLK
ncbi:TetR/AcrR family transcriptional regulator [Planctobacterium marinum]|uniref:TetR/AcrR family transcriptional regulator n=1 Tax=Planctobacterium marinum TaxID=1631968 RepID=UPI001E2EDC28|nr:TetR/AcrR family transcriptional regulator [Planctobacterium marinum]MCC2607354.1 TetR/AcrR family transcriptional regulator [Planctobacterium marinum]